MQSTIRTLKRAIHRLSAHLVTVILHPGALYDLGNFKLWERHGYHITPVDFYSPIIDTRELEKADHSPDGSGKAGCPGLDLGLDSQLTLLKEVFPKYSPEYNAIPVQPVGANAFYLENGNYGGIDPFVYYCMVRHFKPKTITEVGSGYSSLLGVQACQMNGKTRYVCIDPYPRAFIAQGVAGIELIREKVEDLSVDFFLELQPNDIVFIDGSHVIRRAGDVCFMILEVLPRLAPGVVIHFHDIFLPDDYPKDWYLQEQRYWNEQYLLQAYLSDNCHAEILFASRYISQNYPEAARQVFPTAVWIDGASFWIRKR